MTEYERFTVLVPDTIKALIPESRTHHAIWNMQQLIKEKAPDAYAEAVAADASEESKKELASLIEGQWNEVMQWHVKNGFINDPAHPEEIKRDAVPTDSAADQKILALVKPEYLKRIPFFVRKHATGKTCELIAREFPDLYQAFTTEPSDTQKAEMSRLINAIFEERMEKHHM